MRPLTLTEAVTVARISRAGGCWLCIYCVYCNVTVGVNLTEEAREVVWDEISDEVSMLLQGQQQLPDSAVPFDAASSISIEQQRSDHLLLFVVFVDLFNEAGIVHYHHHHHPSLIETKVHRK